MEQINILLIDDDEDEHLLFREAVKNVSARIVCSSAGNGEEALRMLNADLPVLPDIIFLDLNMPRVGGKECLKGIKKIKKLEDIPVIIYTTSKSPVDEAATRQLGAAEFLVKPRSYEALSKQ